MEEFPQITFLSAGVLPIDESTFEVSGDDQDRVITHGTALRPPPPSHPAPEDPT